MLVDVVSKKGWGGLGFGLDLIEKALEGGAGQGDAMAAKPRPWCVVEASNKSLLYLPGLPRAFRQAVSAGRLFWVRTAEGGAPAVVQMMLESGLCEGVLVRGLEKFSRASPAAVWGRRWQLAARKSSAHLFWVHESRHALIGFDARLEWTAPAAFEIKKGHGFFDKEQRFALAHTAAIEKHEGGEDGTDRPAA